MRSRGFLFAAGLLLGVPLGAGLLFAYLKPGRSTPAQATYALQDDILVHGNGDLKEIALTFDDGPHPPIARKLLDYLGKENIRATFFVVGKMVEKNPAIVRRMMTEGHEVGNHTFGHPTLEGMDSAEIREEIARCAHAVYSATGARMHLFRPPGMRYDEIVIRTAQDLGYVTVHWNTAAKDYQPLDPSIITERVLRSARPGSIILLHSHPNTLEALPAIVAELKSRGYRFVRVSQMLSRLPRPVYVSTNAYGVRPEMLAANHPAKKPNSRPSKSMRKIRRSTEANPKEPEPNSDEIPPLSLS